jgi:hypothetical protein
MASLPRLPKSLRDALGPDAAGDLMTILDEMRAQHQDLRRDIRDDFVAFRRDIRSDIQASEERLNARFSRIDDRFERVDARFVALEAKVGDVQSNLMKWSFVFWCGAVAAVAALAGVLRL